DKKFACQACVKGHKSSSCNHTNRKLTKISKKGRPPTQCIRFRELRRTNKIHSMCMCEDQPKKKS
ncbi:copper fist DNA binding domain-containing protein, partial [Phakopsora pachyrhizi]